MESSRNYESQRERNENFSKVEKFKLNVKTTNYYLRIIFRCQLTKSNDNESDPQSIHCSDLFSRRFISSELIAHLLQQRCGELVFDSPVSNISGKHFQGDKLAFSKNEDNFNLYSFGMHLRDDR